VPDLELAPVPAERGFGARGRRVLADGHHVQLLDAERHQVL
jgi:hypothetical protein